MIAKLRSNRGETLAETLFSVLIAALAMIMIAGAVQAAARMNARAGEQQVFSSYEGAGVPAVVSIRKGTGYGATNVADATQWSDGDREISVTLYEDGNEDGLFYYE